MPNPGLFNAAGKSAKDRVIPTTRKKLKISEVKGR